MDIEIAGLSLGDQTEAEGVSLTGITYDAKNDLFEIATDAVDHLVREPQSVVVDYTGDGLYSIEFVDAEGNQHFVALKRPLALPPL